jgi:hypothetical protein
VVSTHCSKQLHMQCAVCSWQASQVLPYELIRVVLPARARFDSTRRSMETRDKESSALENVKTGLVRSTRAPVPAEVPLVYIRNWAGWSAACG